MIAKTVIGATISSALAYGAGELGERSRKEKVEKVDLLATYNLSAQPGDPPKQVHGEIADEMKAVVRDYPGRCQNPVWHTSLSLPLGETLDIQAWTKAVDIYLREVGIDAHRHQVAVFRHRDTAHDHVHIYANRIAMDGGAAVKTGWNYALNVKATRQIEQALNLTPVTKESKRVSLKDHVPGKQVAREVVAQALKNVLQHAKPTNLDELVSDLKKHRITAKIASNVNGPNGISFQADSHQAVKGTAVGYKFNHLSTLLEANRADYQAEIERLRQERDQAEKARQIEEKARQRAEQERDQARNQTLQVIIQEKITEVVKPDPTDKARIEQLEREKQAISSAKAEAEKARQIEGKARQQAERERDQARNQPAQVEIREKLTEVVKPDPADKIRIDQLERDKADLQRRLQLSNQLRGIKGVVTTAEQRAALIDGQKVFLQGLKGKTDTFDGYVSIEGSMLKFRRVSMAAGLPPELVATVPQPILPDKTANAVQADPKPAQPSNDQVVPQKVAPIDVKRPETGLTVEKSALTAARIEEWKPRYEKYVRGRVHNGQKPSSLTEWVKFAEEQYEKGQLDGPDGSRRLVVKEVKPAVKPESKPKKKSGQRVR